MGSRQEIKVASYGISDRRDAVAAGAIDGQSAGTPCRIGLGPRLGGQCPVRQGAAPRNHYRGPSQQTLPSFSTIDGYHAPDRRQAAGDLRGRGTNDWKPLV